MDAPLFYKIIASTVMHLSHLGTSLRIPSRQKLGSCIRNHSRTAMYVSSLLRCLGGPNNRVDGAEVPSKKTATLLADVCCVRLSFCAERSLLGTDHLSAPLKQLLGGGGNDLVNDCESMSPTSNATEFLKLVPR
jgi:hypothetical protein